MYRMNTHTAVDCGGDESKAVLNCWFEYRIPSGGIMPNIESYEC